MIISEQTIEILEDDFMIVFYDNDFNEVSIGKATKIHLCQINMEDGYKAKTINAYRNETPLKYILEQFHKDSIYKNFCEIFKALLPTSLRNSLTCYPASYGIGIFVAIGLRGQIGQTKSEIEKILKDRKIEYTTEYSEANWVFRYKISKSKENIERMKNV